MNDYFSKPIDEDLLIKKLLMLEKSTEVLTGNKTEKHYNQYNNKIISEVLKKYKGMEDTLLKKLLKHFLDNIDERINELNDVVEKKDFEQIEFKVHKLKSSISNFMLSKDNEIFEYGDILELKAFNKDFSEFKENYADFIKNIREYSCVFKDFYKNYYNK